MGRNGAQKTPEAVAAVLGDVGTRYDFVAGRAYNLRADAFVKGHGDVTNPQVVHAVLAALA
jgi:hypothetical protein